VPFEAQENEKNAEEISGRMSLFYDRDFLFLFQLGRVTVRQCVCVDSCCVVSIMSRDLRCCKIDIKL